MEALLLRGTRRRAARRSTSATPTTEHDRTTLSTPSGTPPPSGRRRRAPVPPRTASSPTRSPPSSPRSARRSAAPADVERFVRTRCRVLRGSVSRHRRRLHRRHRPLPRALRDQLPPDRGTRAARSTARCRPRRASRCSTRTDPTVEALAALRPRRRPRPARPGGPARAPRGVIRTDGRRNRTTLLLVRLPLPLDRPRRGGTVTAGRRGRPVLAFTGAPATTPTWLDAGRGRRAARRAPAGNVPDDAGPSAAAARHSTRLPALSRAPRPTSATSVADGRCVDAHRRVRSAAEAGATARPDRPAAAARRRPRRLRLPARPRSVPDDRA